MGNKKYHILLVEDDQDHAFLESQALTTGNGKLMAVDDVKSADEALELIKEKEYDLVVVDYALPGMNGLDLIKKIRRTKNAPATIMLTGVGNEKVAVDAMKAGAYDYITKDGGYLKHMPQTVETAIERHRLEKKLNETRKELRESGAKLKALIEYSPDAAIMKDRTGKYVLLNKKAVYLMNSLGRCNLPSDLAEHLSEVDKEVIEKKDNKVVRTSVDVDGQEMFLEISKYPVLGERKEVLYVCNICRDVTEQRMVEQLKDNLIRDISHELKTPIAVTAMANDMCRRATAAGDIERIKKAQRIADENLDRLSKNVSNILNLFKIGSRRKIGAEEIFSLKKMVGEIKKDLAYGIENQGLEFRVDIPEDVDTFFGGKRAIRTLLYNLVDNAVKFTSKGYVSIKCRLNDGWLEICVEDSGHGILQRDVHNVFDRFYQHHAAVAGTGLGLSICKEVVRLHNGKIDIFSEGKEKGTRVIVKLPGDRVKKQEKA